MSNSISLIAILSLFTLLPFIIASGTCFIKFSIVFVIVRNALGLQQVPSNMTLNGGCFAFVNVRNDAGWEGNI